MAIPMVVGALVFIAALSSGASQHEYQKVLTEHLEAGPAASLQLNVHGRKASDIDMALSDIYHANNLQPYWIENDRPGKRAAAIMAVLDDAHSHGLDPDSYFTPLIHKYWNRSDTVGLVRLDILLTLGVMRYVADQREGRTEPHDIDPHLFATARNVEVAWKPLLKKAFSAPDMKIFLEQQTPPFQQYFALMKKLAEYRALAAHGGWPAVPGGVVLKPGMTDDRIPALRKRLAVTGELAEEYGRTGAVYDTVLGQAVKRFQRNHGLQQDGVVGNQTIAAMNMPIQSRIRQIIINMERYRWLERSGMDKRMVAVNIAGFEAVAGRLAEFDLKMPVIVGTEYHQTPVFSDTIKYVEFNPFWNVPSSIARNEILPKLKNDPSYLKKQKMRLFRGWGVDAKEVNSTAIHWKRITPNEMNSYRIRQDPGPGNALGTLKIMFPNSHDVYLHDTPTRGLFLKDKRALSHGCIRLGRPVDMASWVLGGASAGWSVEKIKSIIASGKRKVITLNTPIPVYILYRTAIVDPVDGTIRFFEDVYGRDALLGKALFGG